MDKDMAVCTISTEIFNLNIIYNSVPLNYEQLCYYDSHLSSPLFKIIKQPLIDVFDRHFFIHSLSTELVRCLQKLCLPYCYQLLVSIPPVAQYFIFLFRKLSISRLCKILSDDNIFLTLYKALHLITYQHYPKEKQYFIEVEIVSTIKQSHRRLIYLYQSINIQEYQLRKSIQDAIKSILKYLLENSKNLIKYTLEEQNKSLKRVHLNQNTNIQDSFLQSLLKTIYTINYAMSFDPSDSKLYHYAFSKSNIKKLSQNFEEYFLTQRRQILKVLQSGFQNFGSSFYQKILDENSCKNAMVFKVMLISNIISKCFFEETIGLLQIMLSNFNKQMLPLLFNIIDQSAQAPILNNDQFELICQFINKMINQTTKQSFSSQLQQKFQNILNLITAHIKAFVEDQHKSYNSDYSNNQTYSLFNQKQTYCNKNTQMCFKLQSRFCICIFHICLTLIENEKLLQKYYKWEVPKTIIKSIRTIILKTKKNKGMIEGVRRNFMKKMKAAVQLKKFIKKSSTKNESTQISVDNDNQTNKNQYQKYSEIIYL